MRASLYEVTGPRQTVSLTLSAELVRAAKAAGLNLSKVAEAALAEALREHLRNKLRAEIAEDLAVHDAFVAEHGSFADAVRAITESAAPI